MDAGHPVPTDPEQARDIDERLRRLVSLPDDEIDLAEAALLVSTHQYPELDIPANLARIAAMSRDLESRIGPQAPVTERIAALNQYLFDELGFGPNAENYYDPRNSCLNDVIERRLGIPITLSLLYIEVGRRIGLPLQGVSFPGHFLVKCAVEDGTIILDPYAAGSSLGMADLQNRLREVRGGEVSRAIVSSLLVAAEKRDIILRLLRNLKAIYLRAQQLTLALPIMHWIVIVAPEQVPELRDRGMIYQELDCFRAAIADFQRYLELFPNCDDAEDIRTRMIELQRSAARLN